MKSLIAVLLMLTAASFAQTVITVSPGEQALQATLTAPCSNANTSCTSTAGSQLLMNSSGFALASVAVSGTYTGVTLNFDRSSDNDSTWYPVVCVRQDAAIAESSEVLGSSEKKAWQCPIQGSTNFRVRQAANSTGSPVITTILTKTIGVNVAGTINRFNCVVAVSTATTILGVGNSCAAPGAGLSLYITDIEFGSSAASGTAADSFPTLKSGTGGTCGTATAVIWQGLSVANSTIVSNLSSPIKVTVNSEICWIMNTAGSKTIQVHGFIAP